MRSPLFSRFSIAAGVASALLATGCAGRARVHYVPYDYFTWNSQEAIVYSQWEHDTHREHIDFTVLSDADMNSFWVWRHRQPEQHRQTINDGLNSVHSGGK
jgi:hypothetical protein